METVYKSRLTSHFPSAFKFLPVLGRYVVDRFENKLPLHLSQKWAFALSYRNNDGDGSRGGPPRRKLSMMEQARL
jgi:sarcosine oxidase/L-pipecolate oxidase